MPRSSGTKPQRGQSGLRAVRDAATLCGLATRLHDQPNVPALVQLLIACVTEAVQADRVAVYLVGTDGRLRCVGGTGDEATSAGDPHVLASLALHNDEALLVHADGASAAQRWGPMMVLTNCSTLGRCPWRQRSRN
jgi:hypothetical protein